MKAIIFAAGLGTRLKPITDTLPKALVPVCGKPLIEHVCLKLKQSGINEAVVNVHHFADKVEKWAAEQDIMTLKISDERASLLETGGAVLHARRYLDGCGSFLVHNVDIISNLDLEWFSTQMRPDSVATLLVSPRNSSRQLLFEPESMKLVGWHNLQTGEVRSPIAGLNPSECLSMAFSGIHIMSDSIFDLMGEFLSVHTVNTSDEPARFSIIDFYIWACASNDIVGVCAENLNLLDVGKLDTLALAEEMLNKM